MVATSGPRGRLAGALNDRRVRAWHAEIALRSKLSADVNARKLDLLLERLKMNPAEVVTLAQAKPERLREVLTRYATELKGSGRTDSYVAKTLDCLRSWLAFNSVTGVKFPRLHIIAGESVQDEQALVPEELRAILAILPPRGRVVALLMSHAGLRPGVIGAYEAESGLTLAALPELVLDEKVRFEKTPFVIRVPAALSKNRRGYITFGSSELAEAITTYLGERLFGGEKLGPTSPLVTISPLAKNNWLRMKREFKGFVTTKSLLFDVSSAIQAALPKSRRVRAYSLRAYFSSRMWLAENDGKITSSQREHMMGHVTIDSRYNLSKKLSPEVMNELRLAYGRAEKFLSTSPRPLEGERDLQTRRVVLRMHGYSEEELAKIDIASKTDDELIALADAKRAENEAKYARPGQKAVPIAEVGKMLEAGWEYVGPLGSDQAILRSWSPSVPRP